MRKDDTDMRKATMLIAIVVAISAFALCDAMAQADVMIKVSPNNLAISSMGTKVTIHSNIPAGSVNVSTLALSINDGAALYPTATFADDRGNLVAKFNMNDVKAMVSVGRAAFTMTGDYFDGGSFSATDVIKVTK